MLTAQDIQVVPSKDEISSDTVCAKFGKEISQKDPFGRRAFAQWIISQIDTKNFKLEEPALFIFSFKVDDMGEVKKVKRLTAQNEKLADLIERTIERSPVWTPYVSNGKARLTHEFFGIVFQPSKGDGESLRPGYFIAPQYPNDGVSGYMDLIDKKIKNSDFRFDIKEYIKRDLDVHFSIHIDQEGKVHAKIDPLIDVDLAGMLKRKLEKSDKWLPGLYLTKPVAYDFNLSILIPAWNEEKEGEKIEDRKREESGVNKEIQRRAAERERQAQADAMRAASGGNGGGGGGGRNR